MSITTSFYIGQTDYVAKLNEMVAQINADVYDLASTIQVKATAAASSATQAAASQTAAASSATQAAASQTAAASSATQAAISQTAAAASAAQALVSETTASSAALSAAASQTAAAASATAAASSASQADSSRSAAASSQIAAAFSEGAAASSATQAAASQTAAASSATQAAASQTAASGSAYQAVYSESQAALSATAAHASQTDAAVSATAANNAALLAQDWASKLGSPVSGTEYSAKYWAQMAAATVVGQVVYMGAWNASIGTYPSAPMKGHWYKVSVTGTVGGITYNAGDSIVYNGSTWDKIDSTDAVTSVNGLIGDVVISYLENQDYFTFNQAYAGANAVGKLQWNAVDGTLDLGLVGGNVVLQVGQEQLLRATNRSGTAYTDGQVVYISGAQGNRPKIIRAIATAEVSSATIIGVVTEPIANNADGFVTTSGIVRGLDTSAFAEGAELWLSPTVLGGITTTRPSAPNHAVLVGYCIRSHASAGSIYVNPQNGWELEELHNVSISTPATNDFLIYNAASGLWFNSTLANTKTILGINNVDNTADIDKPVSTAQQTALNAKVNTSSIVDNLVSTDATVPLSANQGRVLKGLVDAGGAGATGGGSDKVFFNNDQAVTANYSIPSGKNAFTTGPITVNSGVTITIPSGSRWAII